MNFNCIKFETGIHILYDIFIIVYFFRWNKIIIKTSKFVSENAGPDVL